MSIFTLPSAASTALAEIGQRIRLARLRRNWSGMDLAAKAGLNRNTLMAIEAGKPGVAWGAVLATLWALGLEKSLAGVADPDADLHGKALEAARRPQRAARARAKKKVSHDF